jgi:hypothetical protein
MRGLVLNNQYFDLDSIVHVSDVEQSAIFSSLYSFEITLNSGESVFTVNNRKEEIDLMHKNLLEALNE